MRGSWFAARRRRIDDLEKREANLSALLEVYEGRRRTWAGVSVNDDEALRLGAVWTCVDLISELVSTLPVAEGRIAPTGELRPQPRSRLLEDPDNSGYGFEVWCRQLLMSMLMRGNGYGWITELSSRDGWPTTVELIHPDEITTKRLRSGETEWYRDNKYVERWPAGPLWHVPAYVVPGSPVGLAPISYAAQAIGLGLAAQKFGAQWFADGAHPTTVFESDQVLNADDARLIKERVIAATSGNREPLVLGYGLKLNPLQVTPEESQFLETVKANADDIARYFFRRPPSEGGQVTYANVEARSLDLLTYTLTGWMVRVERALTRLRPRPVVVKFNADALIRVDTLSRYKAHDMAIRAGWRSRNDVRRIEDEAPIPDGDLYLWPPYATATFDDPDDPQGVQGDGPPQPS